MRRRILREGANLLGHLVVLLAAAGFAFARNIHALFYHFDGLCTYIEMRYQLRSGAATLSFTNDLFQSVGNMQFLQNSTFLFFFWPIGWFADYATGVIAVYLLIAGLVFLAAYGFARLFDASQPVCLLAGWGLAVLATPMVPGPAFYPILWVAPTMVLMVVSASIASSLLLPIGRNGPGADLSLGLGLFALALYLLAANPSLLAVFLPGFVPYLVAAFVAADGRGERLRKLAVLVALAAVAVALQWPWFLLGVFSHTPSHLMSGDFTPVYNDPIYISLLFHGGSVGWGGPLLVGLAVLGALGSLRGGTRRSRVFAWTLLVVVGTLVGLRSLLFLSPRWILPPPLYSEIALWPLYAFFASAACCRIAAAAARLLPAAVRSLDAATWLPVPAAAVALLFALSTPPMSQGYPFPPRGTPIVEVLRERIALAPNAAFNGRVATVLPLDGSGEDPWIQQFVGSLKRANKVGSDQFAAHLWYEFIPTLFEYSPFISPFFHSLVKRSLQRPAVVHPRNVTVLTHPDLRVLALLGVRYVVSNKPEAGGATPVVADAPGDDRWTLFEVPRPNIATYAPTSVEVRRDLKSAFDFILDETKDLSSSAVVASPVEGPLVGLDQSSLSIQGMDLRLRARSGGRSLVVVPLEYSNCLELRTAGPSAGTARLVRTDGLLTGVLFDREVDAVLAFRTGPLANPSCRWKDYREFKDMVAD